MERGRAWPELTVQQRQSLSDYQELQRHMPAFPQHHAVGQRHLLLKNDAATG